MAMYRVARILPKGKRPNRREKMVKSAMKITLVKLDTTLLMVWTDDWDRLVGVKGVVGSPTGVAAGDGWWRYLRCQQQYSEPVCPAGEAHEGCRSVWARREIEGPQDPCHQDQPTEAMLVEAARTLMMKQVTRTGQLSSKLYHSPISCVRCCWSGEAP